MFQRDIINSSLVSFSDSYSLECRNAQRAGISAGLCWRVALGGLGFINQSSVLDSVKGGFVIRRRLLPLCPTMFFLFRMTCLWSYMCPFPSTWWLAWNILPQGYKSHESNSVPRDCQCPSLKPKSFLMRTGLPPNETLPQNKYQVFCLFWGHSVEPEISTLDMTSHMQKAVC